jgi:DNA-directed RNA polymerase subunit N (RpoN/RPB10)
MILRHVPLIRQEMLTRPEHLFSLPVLTRVCCRNMLVRKHMDVNEHDRLFNITFRHKFK